MILKAIAWTWLVLVFVTITAIALWQIITNLEGLGGLLGFIWVIPVFIISLVLAVKVAFPKL